MDCIHYDFDAEFVQHFPIGVLRDVTFSTNVNKQKISLLLIQSLNRNSGFVFVTCFPINIT